MLNQIKFRHDKLDTFGIITDQKYPGTDAFFDFDRIRFINLVDGILGGDSSKLKVYHDKNFSYMYYMLTYIKNVQKWYNKDTFTIYECDTNGKSNQLLFVKNNKNGWLDNVIYKRCLDDIQSRIEAKSIAYVSSTHAIERATLRIPEIADCKSKFKISKWLLNQVNRNSKSAHIKKEFAAFSLLNHHFEKADYYMDPQRNVYVIVNHTIATIHCNESERWKLN